MLPVIRLEPVFRYGMAKHRPGEGVGMPISAGIQDICKGLYSIFSKKTPIVFFKNARITSFILTVCGVVLEMSYLRPPWKKNMGQCCE